MGGRAADMKYAGTIIPIDLLQYFSGNQKGFRVG